VFCRWRRIRASSPPEVLLSEDAEPWNRCFFVGFLGVSAWIAGLVFEAIRWLRFGTSDPYTDWDVVQSSANGSVSGLTAWLLGPTS
jgi:hypothetical protein